MSDAARRQHDGHEQTSRSKNRRHRRAARNHEYLDYRLDAQAHVLVGPVVSVEVSAVIRRRATQALPFACACFVDGTI